MTTLHGRCPHCSQPLDVPRADRLSIHGMYDCHLFHRIEGETVDALIEHWRAHIAQPIPARIDGQVVADLGPSWFTPVIVLSVERELRRVGQGIWPDYQTRRPRSEAEVAAFRAALLADPDIPRLLAQA